MSLLAKYLRSHARVRVVVRRRTRVRGFCTGHLKAFDKHMNLFLVDVCEQFRRRITPESDTEEEEECDQDGTNEDAVSRRSLEVVPLSRSVAAPQRLSSDIGEGRSPSATMQEGDLPVNWSDDGEDDDEDNGGDGGGGAGFPGAPNNVEAEGTAPPRLAATALPQQRRRGDSRLPPAQRYETVRRFLKQVLIRGDSVVVVHEEPQELQEERAADEGRSGSSDGSGAGENRTPPSPPPPHPTAAAAAEANRFVVAGGAASVD